MRRKYFTVVGLLVIFCAATACSIGTPSPTSDTTPVLPTATDTAVLVPTETATLALTPTYAVVLVPEGGTLEAYTSAGSGNPAAGSLVWDAVDLHSTGNVDTIGADTWVELNLAGGGTGWVDRKNLTEYVPAGAFCADARATALFAALGSAVSDSDGSALAALVSPVHGLTVIYLNHGAPRVYSPADAGLVFGSDEIVEWGLGPGSGLPIRGTFADFVRPDLLTVLSASYETHCNAVTLGGASYNVIWPAQWKNINFYSVYKPGSPGTELDWMTWLTGVEYVDGNPYLFLLSRYNWEP
jgi:hypothetical protein